nr:EOG090X04IO [Eulimnadia texana]
MASGVTVTDACKLAFEKIKSKKEYRYVVFFIKDERFIDVEKTGDRDATYDQFLTDLQVTQNGEHECRYGLFDFEYTHQCQGTQEGKKQKLFLMSWCPDNAKVKKKMLYSSSFDALKKALVGVAKYIQELPEDARVLQRKITTLLGSLAAISAEKSRIEASFQNDRKRLIFERDELEKSLAAACSEADEACKNFRQEILELKNQLSAEKSERSKETTNNQIVLRELQKTIAEERQLREALQLELNVKSSRLSQYTAQVNRLEVAEKKVKELTAELESTQAKLRQCEEVASQPSPVITELQRELAELKAQHLGAFHSEQKRAAEAEETVRQLVASHESRVAVLEGRLSELSQTIGTYDRLRQQDLATITILKDQLCALERTATHSYVDSCDPEEAGSDTVLLLEKIVKLYTAAQAVNQSLGEPVQISVTVICKYNPQEKQMNTRCFRQQHISIISNLIIIKRNLAICKVVELSLKTTTGAASEVGLLQDKLKLLMEQLFESEERNQHKVRQIEESMLQERERLKEEFLAEERNLKLRIADLEYQMKKQRERSLNLMEEKDEEIRNLRSMLQINPFPASKESTAKAENEPEWPEGLGPLASLAIGATASGGQILHYVEELARKDIEIQGLRKSKGQLETCLRELQMTAAAKEEENKAAHQSLRESVERLQRNSSRESANLEYLKNVIFNFLTRPGSQSQAHMVNAISTILHFSPREVQLVAQAHPSWKLGAPYK